MIRRALLRAGAVLAAFSILGLPAAASNGTRGPCKSGNAAGAWDLPVAGQPGTMRGALEHEGRPRFILQGVLVPRSSSSVRSPRRGELHGMLSIPTPSGPMPIARVKGEWASSANGQGKYRAIIFRPGPNPTSPVRLMGRMHGSFADPSATDPGRFRGRWQICG